MDFETLETIRVKYIQETLEAMVKLMQDPTVSAEDKVKAARTVDAISDTIVKSHLLSDSMKMNDSQIGKLSKQIDKLTDRDSEY